MISCRSRGSGASSRRTLQMHANKIVIISRVDDTRLYNRSITAFCRLYAGKTPHFNIPQERKALRNNFIGSVFFTFSPVRLS
jgi:hypothetical protein